jgi:hypothetical protein
MRFFQRKFTYSIRSPLDECRALSRLLHIKHKELLPDSSFIRLLDQGRLTPLHFAALQEHHINALLSNPMLMIDMENENLFITDFLQMGFDETSLLGLPSAHRHFSALFSLLADPNQHERFTKEWVMLDHPTKLKLNNNIFYLIHLNQLGLSEFSDLSDHQKDLLRDDLLNKILVQKIWNKHDLLSITPIVKSLIIRDPNFRRLIFVEKIDFTSFMQRAGEALRHQHHTQVESDINNGQSTHNSSINLSCRDSIKKMKQRYSQHVNSHTKFRSQLKKPEVKPEANLVAIRCFDRLLATEHNEAYVEMTRFYQVSMPELLSLVYLAATDEAVIAGSANDGVALLIEGLNEIQRGGNEVASGEDIPICAEGTVHKLIEKLCSFHPDCNLNFVSPGTITAKFISIVNEKLLDHLAQQSPSERHLDGDVLEYHWSAIKPMVEDAFYREFEFYFQPKGKESEYFTQNMANWEYIGIDVDTLREQLQQLDSRKLSLIA